MQTSRMWMSAMSNARVSEIPLFTACTPRGLSRSLVAADWCFLSYSLPIRNQSFCVTQPLAIPDEHHQSDSLCTPHPPPAARYRVMTHGPNDPYGGPLPYGNLYNFSTHLAHRLLFRPPPGAGAAGGAPAGAAGASAGERQNRTSISVLL